MCMNFINQDLAENFFSECRRRCGRNDTPNAEQIAASVKYASILLNDKITEGQNCEEDDAETLLQDDEIPTFAEFSAANQIEYKYKKVPLRLDGHRLYTTNSLNGLVYIVGASARKLHKRCKKNLVARRQTDDLNKEIFSFCEMKRAKTVPNTKLMELGLLVYTIFDQRFKPMLYQSKKNVKRRMKEYILHNDFKKQVCRKCFDVLVDKLFNTLIQGFIRRTNAALKLKLSKSHAPATTKRNRKAVRMNLPE